MTEPADAARCIARVLGVDFRGPPLTTKDNTAPMENGPEGPSNQ